MKSLILLIALFGFYGCSEKPKDTEADKELAQRMKAINIDENLKMLEIIPKEDFGKRIQIYTKLLSYDANNSEYKRQLKYNTDKFNAQQGVLTKEAKQMGFSYYKEEVDSDFKKVSNEENYLKNSGYKSFTVSEKDEYVLIEPIFSNFSKYNKVGKQMLLKSFSASFAYVVAEYLTKCRNKDGMSNLDKISCYKTVMSYTFDKSLVFVAKDIKINGNNVKKDFMLNADDVNKIKKLKLNNKEWYKSP